MSYEGYTQYLCQEGHYWTVDSSVCVHWGSMEEIRCPNCRSLPKWLNEVDVTNGVNEYYPESLDLELMAVSEYDIPMTDHRGNNYFLQGTLWAPKDPSKWQSFTIEDQNSTFTEDEVLNEALKRYRAKYGEDKTICKDLIKDAMKQNSFEAAVQIIYDDTRYWDGQWFGAD